MPPIIFDVSRLPIEMLHLICKAADHRDFYAIALAGRTLNEIITPVLYSAIALRLPHAIYACVRTLASTPSESTMNRDFAAFVKTLSLNDPHYHLYFSNRAFKDNQRSVVARRLADVVPRMRRLQSITCRLGISLMLPILTTLTSTPLPFVNAIHLTLCSTEPDEPDADMEVATVAVQRHPRLEILKLGCEYDPPEWCKILMCSLVAAGHATLRTLAIRDHADPALDAAWQSIPSFPALEELSIAPDLLNEPAFYDTSRIRRLIVPEDYWDDLDDLELSPTALPNLEDVTCFPLQLDGFLPEDAAHRRPISAVTFNHVKYETTRDGGHFSIETHHTYTWSEIQCGVSAVQFSGAPLLRLGFVVHDLSVKGLSSLLPYIKDLEYLLIVVENPEEWRLIKDDIFSMAEVLGHMPRLHTFLISDVLLKIIPEPEGGPFKYAHDEDYQRAALSLYDQHSSSLRRVAFTTELEWEKRDDGWHSWGHVTPPWEPVTWPEIVSNEGGEDEKQEEAAIS